MPKYRIEYAYAWRENRCFDYPTSHIEKKEFVAEDDEKARAIGNKFIEDRRSNLQHDIHGKVLQESAILVCIIKPMIAEENRPIRL